MANCMLGFPNNIDSAALSGGSFFATMPRSKIQTRKLRDVARTTDTAPANTLVVIDLTKVKNTRAIALVNHNFSLQAKYRVTGSNDNFATAAAYDSGWLDVWPVAYPYGTKEWEDPSWFGGKYSSDEIKGYTPQLIHLLPGNKLLRYWKVEINDSTNTDGYLQWGRMFIGPVWQPQTNMAWGASLGWETKTEVQESTGGSESFDVKTPVRIQKYKLDWLDPNEAMAGPFELQKQAGIDKEVLWINDPDDTVNAMRTRFLGRFRSLSPIEYPYWQNNSTAFEIKELK